MKTSLTTEELEERSEALRDAFPDMPRGGRVLIDALLDAATLDDDEAPQAGAEPDRPE